MWGIPVDLDSLLLSAPETCSVPKFFYIWKTNTIVVSQVLLGISLNDSLRVAHEQEQWNHNRTKCQPEHTMCKIWALIMRVGFKAVQVGSGDPQVRKIRVIRLGFGIGKSSRALCQYEWFAGMPVWAKANCIRFWHLPVYRDLTRFLSIEVDYKSLSNSNVIHY